MTRQRLIHDISLPISARLPVWPGDPPVEIRHETHLDRGDVATTSALSLGAHTGTHVDAPAHFIQGGAGAEALALEVLVGPALVVSIPEAAALTVALLEAQDLPPGVERVLFRTRNSRFWERAGDGFREDFTALDEAAARWLVARGVRLVGIDYLSIAPFADGVPTHRALLAAGVVVVEGLDLRAIRPGFYQLVCLPLKLVGCDGAPARAILVEEDGGEGR